MEAITQLAESRADELRALEAQTEQNPGEAPVEMTEAEPNLSEVFASAMGGYTNDRDVEEAKDQDPPKKRGSKFPLKQKAELDFTLTVNDKFNLTRMIKKAFPVLRSKQLQKEKSPLKLEDGTPVGWGFDTVINFLHDVQLKQQSEMGAGEFDRMPDYPEFIQYLIVNYQDVFFFIEEAEGGTIRDDYDEDDDEETEMIKNLIELDNNLAKRNGKYLAEMLINLFKNWREFSRSHKRDFWNALVRMLYLQIKGKVLPELENLETPETDDGPIFPEGS